MWDRSVKVVCKGNEWSWKVLSWNVSVPMGGIFYRRPLYRLFQQNHTAAGVATPLPIYSGLFSLHKLINASKWMVFNWDEVRFGHWICEFENYGEICVENSLNRNFIHLITNLSLFSHIFWLCVVWDVFGIVSFLKLLCGRIGVWRRDRSACFRRRIKFVVVGFLLIRMSYFNSL